MKKDKWYVFLIFICIALSAAYLLIIQSRKVEMNKLSKILERKEVVTGKIVDYYHCAKCAVSYKYIFIYKGQKHEGIATPIALVDEYSKLRSLCLEKYFPVILDSLEPETNRMLITPNDFKASKIQFPDSLKWIKEYFN